MADQRSVELVQSFLERIAALDIPPGPPQDLGSAILRLGQYLGAFGPEAAVCGVMLINAFQAERERARPTRAEIKAEMRHLEPAEIREAIPNVLAAMRETEHERCAKIVREQPYYPDTHTGMRQQWVKDQIVAKIEALD